MRLAIRWRKQAQTKNDENVIERDSPSLSLWSPTQLNINWAKQRRSHGQDKENEKS